MITWIGRDSVESSVVVFSFDVLSTTASWRSEEFDFSSLLDDDGSARATGGGDDLSSL